VTLIGNGFQEGISNGTRRGVRIRTGATGILQNIINTEFPDDGVRVEDLEIAELGQTMILDNVHSFKNRRNYEQEASTFFFNNPSFNVNEQPVPGISLTEFVGSVNTTFNPATLGNFFEPASYAGAVHSLSNDWTSRGAWFKNLDGTIR
jgi:hypothetical protein